MRWLVLVALTGCGRFGFDSHASPSDPDPDSSTDSDIHDGPLGAWSAPVPFPGGINTDAGNENDVALTANGLELYITREDGIYHALRTSTAVDFGAPTKDLQLSMTGLEDDATPSNSGLEMFFARNMNVFRATRAHPTGAWDVGSVVEELSTADDDAPSWISPDGLRIYLQSQRAGTGMRDLYVATRPSIGAAWTTPVEIAELDSDANDVNPTLSADELTLVFDSDRGNAINQRDLYIATRAAIGHPWSAPIRIDELSTGSAELDAFLAPDGRTLMFTSDRGGSNDIWVSSR
jgi:hypothetical protein